MSLTIYPYKITQKELEARLEPGVTVLPGQYLRFATAEPIFGQVREVRALASSSPGMGGGYRLLIDMLYGTPSLQPQQVIPLNATQMGHEIQRLQEPIAEPLKLSAEFSAEFHRLGPLTLISGDDFERKYEVLHWLMGAIRPYRKLVIIDPLGVFDPDDDLKILHAGKDIRLSLQAVGSMRFLETFGELFTPSLREAALRVVADHLPSLTDFHGFQGLVEWYGALNVTLKNLILQNLLAVAHSHVFADTAKQALDWKRVLRHPATVLDLSGLQEPWRGLFYREVMRSLLMQSEEVVIPVLIYPENYLPQLPQWIKQADESEFRLLMLASPYVDKTLLSIAGNHVHVESPDGITLRGSLTMGLPLTLPMSTVSAPPFEEAKPIVISSPDESISGFSSFNVPLLEEEAEEIPKKPRNRKTAQTDEEEEFQVPQRNRKTSDKKQTEKKPEVEKLVQLPELVPEEGKEEEEDTWDTDWRAEHAEDDDVETLENQSLEVISSASLGVSEFMQNPSYEQEAPSVVDLSDPQLEETPEFLTTSQLSRLLSSGNRKPAGSQTKPSVSPLLTSETSAPGNGDQQSIPQESTLPEQLPPPAAVIPEASQAPEEKIQPQENFQFQEETEETWDTPDEWTYSPEATSMPTPEEPAEPEPGHRGSTTKVSVTPSYALEDDDEFHFDLNPHETSAAPAFRASPPAEHAPSSIMNTLDAFSTDDFSFNAQLQPSQEGQDMWDTQQGLDETLDFIFPNLPSQSTPETEAEPGPQIEIGELTPVKIAPSSPDMPITIIQKPVEPSVSEEGGFQSGDRVKHPTYGMGVVQKVIPTEESVVLNITFDQVGKRLLDPALSALTRA